MQFYKKIKLSLFVVFSYTLYVNHFYSLYFFTKNFQGRGGKSLNFPTRYLLLLFDSDNPNQPFCMTLLISFQLGNSGISRILSMKSSRCWGKVKMLGRVLLMRLHYLLMLLMVVLLLLLSLLLCLKLNVLNLKIVILS